LVIVRRVATLRIGREWAIGLKAMPTYVYETIPTIPDQPVRRFEVKQSMSEPALTKDPQTGVPVHRVISGGFGLMVKGGAGDSPAGGSGDCGDGACGVKPPTHSCGTGCGCFPG
jgi:predicted nucleic acid-binding Zn ribbon protein